MSPLQLLTVVHWRIQKMAMFLYLALHFGHSHPTVVSLVTDLLEAVFVFVWDLEFGLEVLPLASVSGASLSKNQLYIAYN